MQFAHFIEANVENGRGFIFNILFLQRRQSFRYVREIFWLVLYSEEKSGRRLDNQRRGIKFETNQCQFRYKILEDEFKTHICEMVVVHFITT